jgi:hypothetical protein
MTDIDRDDFAVQMDYVARLGKLVAPWALSFLEDIILFTGDDPFSAEELTGLLPSQVECYEDYEAPEDLRFNIVVVGQTDFSKKIIRSAIDGAGVPPRFLPQEGFLDELLFGHDWWDTEIEWLNGVLRYHPGLQYVKSLETFPWPGTEAEESEGAVDSEAEFQTETRLYQLGYKITGRSRSECWRILTSKAVPELGLEEVVGTIASHCRTRKRQRGGRTKYAHAIGEWEHDLERLRHEVYPDHRPRCVWPQEEP